MVITISFSIVEDSQASSHTGLAGKELRQLYLALAENK
jgi:hypothetical protein